VGDIETAIRVLNDLDPGVCVAISSHLTSLCPLAMIRKCFMHHA